MIKTSIHSNCDMFHNDIAGCAPPMLATFSFSEPVRRVAGLFYCPYRLPGQKKAPGPQAIRHANEIGPQSGLIVFGGFLREVEAGVYSSR